MPLPTTLPIDARPVRFGPHAVRQADRDERPHAEPRLVDDAADLQRLLVAGVAVGAARERAERVADQIGDVARHPQERRERRDAARHLDPRRLAREGAAQVVLRDHLVADLGVRDRAAPQRRRAVRAQADRLVESSGRLVGPAEAEHRVAQPLPGDRMLREQLAGALEPLGCVNKPLRTEVHVALLDEEVGRDLAHPSRYHGAAGCRRDLRAVSFAAHECCCRCRHRMPVFQVR